ncbi:MAG: AbrB/MazE/SpoVT family DNA-binding domain-containing protein [Acidobacteriota bacterium]
MITTIDIAGRIVIPKPIRTVAKLTAGSRVNIRLRDGIIEIEPVPVKVRVKPKHQFWVAVPEERAAPLTQEMVNEAIESVRSRK